MRSPLARWREHLLGAPGPRSGARTVAGSLAGVRFALAPSRAAVTKPNRPERHRLARRSEKVAAVRFMLLLAIVCQVVTLAGCAYCASPYDCCGPTFTGDRGECLVDERYGSILSGPMFHPIAGPEFLPEGYEELGPYGPLRGEDYAPSAEDYTPSGEELPEPAPLEDLLPEPRPEDTIPSFLPPDLEPPPDLQPPPELRPPFDEGRRPRSIRLRR